MDMEISSHRAENTRYLGVIEILRSKFWIQKYTEIGPVLDAKIICHLEVHSGLEIQVTTTSGRQHPSMFELSCPETQIDTMMSYDTEIQKHILEKLIKNVCRTRIKSNRPFNRKRQMITFRLMNGNGKTSLPMNSADTSGNLTRKLSVSWYDMKIAETEKQMEQFIGNRFPKLVITFRRDRSRELTDRDGSLSFGKEAAKPASSIFTILAKNYGTSEPFKVTQEEK